ncbi:MAG TPA: D-glycerate dehydrogenase [Patescibacteria group bacterium]|nr:D-glycerate dehydrogenase [Patescibacteria group bacterium]
MHPSVFITRQIPDEGIKLLSTKKFKLDIYQKDQIIPRAELLKRVKGKDAIISLLTEQIDEEVLLAAGPRLQIVANYAVGFDNIDLSAAKKHRVTVTNTPSPELSEAVAEHAMALMLALARHIPEADAYTRAEKYQGWSPTLFLGTDLHDKTLGIIGLGRIGQALAIRAVNGFCMKCVYTNPNPNPAFEKTFHAKRLALTDLLKVSDFVSIHVPLLPTTRHLISSKELKLMKKTAFLVNTSRGPIIDETALLHALKSKRIAGAGLDVYECEPAIDCNIHDRLTLKKFPNTILTPHTASATIETRQAMSRLAAQNIIAVLTGKKPLTPAK